MLPFLLKPGIKKVNWGLSFELGLTLFMAYQCQARELVTESASEGSIMLAVYLLLVPLVELGFGRPFTSKKAASLAVAVGGVALLAAGVVLVLQLPLGHMYGGRSGTSFSPSSRYAINRLGHAIPTFSLCLVVVSQDHACTSSSPTSPAVHRTQEPSCRWATCRWRL